MILSIQALRGILALAVAVGHSLLITDLISKPIDEAPANWIGLFIFQQSTAVVIFFVISGFVLEPSLSRPLGSFLVRRALRLWPIALLSIAIGMLYIALAPVRTIDTASAWFNGLYAKDIGQASLITNLLLLEWDFNGVLWSIYIEAVAAIALPVMILAKRFAWPYQFGAWLLLVAVSYIDAPNLVKLGIGFLHCFYIGLYVSTLGKSVTAAHFLLAVALLPAAEIAMTVGWISMDTKFVLNSICGFAIVSFLANRVKASPRPLVRLGDISYGFYAVHLPVMHIVAMTLMQAAFSPLAVNWLTALISVPVAIALAVPIHRLVNPSAIAGAGAVSR